MTPGQYEELKEIIQKANPEIMELKFGCEVRFNLYQEVFIYVRPIADGKYEIIKKWGKKICKVKLDEITILGREIRLADVLLACTKMSVPEIDINVFGSPQMPEGGLLMKSKNGGGIWNLKNDNLDYQSEETKQFLFDLLYI